MAPKIAALATILATIVVAMTPAATDAMSTEQQQQQQQQHLRKLSRDSNELVHQGNGAFVDGTETIYDDFSLAWRFLGFYTDCNVCVDGDDDDEGDGGDEEFRDTAECIQDGADNTVCRRFALWAAYVDEGYEGNGKNEYQFYDRQHKRWNDSQCNDDDSRCVKLDCHDPYSKNFKLIGVYKDHKIGNFLENMIDHSGDCVWNDNEYKFMQAMNNNNNNNNNNNADYWPPTKCRAFKNGHGYYDAIPSEGGNLELEIFNDASCTVPYEIDNSSGFTPEQKLGRTKGDLDSWNAAMDAFKICQPCVSYDTIFLNSINNKKHGYNAHGDRYGDQGDDDAAGGDYFVCNNNLQQDEPTNQCKVFMEEGQDSMSKATYRDILRKWMETFLLVCIAGGGTTTSSTTSTSSGYCDTIFEDFLTVSSQFQIFFLSCRVPGRYYGHRPVFFEWASWQTCGGRSFCQTQPQGTLDSFASSLHGFLWYRLIPAFWKGSFQEFQ